jgi:hypothetical protein
MLSFQFSFLKNNRYMLDPYTKYEYTRSNIKKLLKKQKSLKNMSSLSLNSYAML